MNNATKLSFESATVTLFPQDLGAWLDDTTLARLAREGAEIFYWVGADEDDDQPSFGGCHCPLRKLALLSYCYARGCYPSEEIAALLAAERGLATTDDPTSDSLSPTGGEEAFAVTLCKLSANARFSADKLRLFRSHNSELLKLTLAFVLRHAWDAKFGEACALRDFLLAESASRLQRAIFADRVIAASSSNLGTRRKEAHSVTHHAPRTTQDQSVATSSATGNGFAGAAILLLALLLFLIPARAAETLPPFKVDGRAYTNAVVIESNPVDVLIRQEELGFKRLKRQEMPAELQDRFPYDAKEVEEYEKQKAAKTKAQREQQRRDAYHALLRQDRELAAQLDRAERDLMALQKEINVRKSQAHRRPRSAERQAAIQCQERKIGLERHIENLRRQLEAVRAQQIQYR